MIEPFVGPSSKYRFLAGVGILVLVFQWWLLPSFPEAFAQKWLWSLDPARSFPLWFRIVFPLFLIFFPVRFASHAVACLVPRPPHSLLTVALLSIGSGLLFWLLRIGRLELGDAKLIIDHFISLTTYASVREPLESILHTEWCRFLFFGWGVHPLTGFQILSCGMGVGTVVLVTWGLNGIPIHGQRLGWYALFLFLVGPIHLFFGYVEWYTQLAAGIIVFQAFALGQWFAGKGLWIALWALIFACCSHLVGLAFVPAALLLIWFSRKGFRRWTTLGLFAAALAFSLSVTLLWLRRHIQFESSVDATSNLFSTLLPFMREDNPNNPPGSWTYAWLSGNHIGDLLNELFLCGYFSFVVLIGVVASARKKLVGEDRDSPHPRESGDPELGKSGGSLLDSRFRGDDDEERFPPMLSSGFGPKNRGLLFFFGLELGACAAFLLLWNPWLGFPLDWDLFSFFAWPLLAASVTAAFLLQDRAQRTRLFWIAGIPAFSVVASWVIGYHHGSLPSPSDCISKVSGTYFDRCLEKAHDAREKGNWTVAFVEVEEAMKENPGRMAECFAVFDVPTLQRMSTEWPGEESLTPLAVDFEIVAASPMHRILVLDCWGRVFFWEGGYLNDWAPAGLPGIPERRAVDMEIVPWKQKAVVLRDDGELYEVPISSWVNPNPSKPRETHFLKPPGERVPVSIGNFYEDLAKQPLPRGQSAVSFTVDHWNKRLIALDTSGNLISDVSPESFAVDRKAALIRTDCEANYNGEFVFVIDTLGEVTVWPGYHSPVQVLLHHGWHSITDLELGRGGNDVYVLDGQGAVLPFSRLESAPINPSEMKHYLPTGELAEGIPYITDPFVFFIDLEIVPNEKAFFRMTRNFRIHYSEAP